MFTRKIRTLAFLLCLPWLTAHAFNPEVELQGATVKQQGQCQHEGSMYMCYTLESKGKLYLIVMGNQVLAIYGLKELKGEYKEEDITLLWKPEQRRKNDRNET